MSIYIFFFYVFQMLVTKYTYTFLPFFVGLMLTFALS